MMSTAGAVGQVWLNVQCMGAYAWLPTCACSVLPSHGGLGPKLSTCMRETMIKTPSISSVTLVAAAQVSVRPNCCAKLPYDLYSNIMRRCYWNKATTWRWSRRYAKGYKSIPLPSVAPPAYYESLDITLMFQTLNHQPGANRIFAAVSCSHSGTQAYNRPGRITYRFFLYLSPNSLRYLLSFFLAQAVICASPMMINTTVLKLQLTRATPTQERASNM